MESSTPSLFFLGGNLNTIYLLVGYNNYYNRQLKKLATVQQYLQAAQQYYQINDVVNFNPADGISTKHIFNFQVYDLEGPEPDYMIVVNNDTIEQRWFVLDGDRTRAGQYEVSLYRDTVAEQWQNIGNLPMFVEKAIVAQTDPAIFNSENMSFNQIKQEETLLKDSTDCAWVVGYMTQDNVERSNVSFLGDRETDYILNNLSDYPYYDYTTIGGQYMDVGLGTASNTFRVFMNPTGGDASHTTQMIFSGAYGMGASFSTLSYYIPTQLTENDTSKRTAFGQYVNDHANLIKAAIASELQLKEDLLEEESHKLIYVQTTGKYYTISVTTSISGQITKVPKEGTGVFNAFEKVIQDAQDLYPLLTTISVGSDQSYKYTVSTIQKQIQLTEATFTDAIKYRISSGRNRLKDQPYSMFCMPYGTCAITGLATRNWKEITLKIAQNMSFNFGGAAPVLYDIQLLPYFPFRDMLTNGTINLSNGTEGKDYDLIKQNGVNVGIMFWATKSTDTFNIIHTIAVQDYKIENETKMYRLVSPNYNGVFEFSAAKNGGVGSFNVDFTYKPYQPYIHVNPNFGLLYGQDFDDARGLICGGKFDLPQTSDAWATYERQNTSYNSVFNRQIDNLELQNKIGKTADVVSAIAGSFQGAGSGASMGAAGGPWGAAAGAIIGGATSLAAGVADIQINNKLRDEVVDYRKDLYGYNLQNIQAQPTNLLSVGALNANNKLFPFLEEYDCTSTERNALINKIRFNGMTVGRIGTINEFKNNNWSYSNGWNYIKGQLIRLPIWGDTHYIATLASEMKKGIFVEV